jgi:hypothetical protein
MTARMKALTARRDLIRSMRELEAATKVLMDCLYSVDDDNVPALVEDVRDAASKALNNFTRWEAFREVST